LGIKEDADEEIKIAIPNLMKGIIQLYTHSNVQVIPMLYQMKFGPFILREIQKGDNIKISHKKKDEEQLINKYRKVDANIKINMQIA